MLQGIKELHWKHKASYDVLKKIDVLLKYIHSD